MLGEFRLASPERDFDEGRFLLFLALVVVPDAVDGHADFGNSGALRSVAQFGIPGEIADEHDFVEIGHNREDSGLGGAAGAVTQATRTKC